MDISPVMAAKLVDEHKITSIPELHKVFHLLQKHPQICLTYYDEFNQRIPREEVK